MGKTSIRELKHATSAVLEKVKRGETLQITRRNQVVAVLGPPPSTSGAVNRPDFAARLRELWGDRRLPTTATELLTEERGDR